MKKNMISKAVLSLILLSFSMPSQTYGNPKGCGLKETIETDAGTIDFGFTRYIINVAAHHTIQAIQPVDKTIVLDDGSKWGVSKIEVIADWQKSGPKLFLTQNHTVLSTTTFALVNPESKKAVPVKLLREPNPANQCLFYVAKVDVVNDIITTNDGKKWIGHSSDKNTLAKFNEHDRLIIGVNTLENQEDSPYILINTASNSYIRAKILD